MPLALLVSFVLWVALELWVLVRVAALIGAGPAVLLLVLASLAGITLVRRAGARALRRMGGAAEQGRRPGSEVVDGALIVVAGVLLALPGFVSAAVGLLLLLPPVRVLTRRIAARLAARRVAAFVALAGRTPFAGRPSPGSSPGDRPGRPADVEGSATEEGPTGPARLHRQDRDGMA